MKCKLTFTLYREYVKDNLQNEKKESAGITQGGHKKNRQHRRENVGGSVLPDYLTEVFYCAFTTNYNKPQQQCQIKNPGGQLTIRKGKKGNQPPGFNKRSETTDQLHIKYRTSSPNVNSKKQKNKK